MSERFPGGIITNNPATPTGPFENGSAPGIWTLEQQAEFVRQGIWPIAGNVPNYIEDVFSTWLYTGNGSTQTITNGIDLAGKGGMTWIKPRNQATSNMLFDTSRGTGRIIYSDATAAQSTDNNSLTAFNSNGFSLGTSGQGNGLFNYASWTFREQPKFFDVVTYTGNGSARTIAHNLGSVPGCMIVKRTDALADWAVYHRSVGEFVYYSLNSSSTFTVSATVWNSTSPSSTVFSVGNNSVVNASGGTYVAYLFAHNAGGFGLTGTDNVISCGTYGGNGSTTGPVIDLGYEPQWLMIRNVNSTGNWQIIDNMRGMPVGSADATLQANLTNAESSVDYVSPTATGFQVVSTSSEVNSESTAYMYIAIRRGPMKVPTTGTSVFAPVAVTPTAGSSFTTNFPFDSSLLGYRLGNDGGNWTFIDRLRGYANASGDGQPVLRTSSTGAEFAAGTIVYNTNNTGGLWGSAYAGLSDIFYFLRRAPGFMDVCCYTGTGVARTVAHNLAAVPELMIVKSRSQGGDWPVYAAIEGPSRGTEINSTGGFYDASTQYWNSTNPTSTQFTVGTNAALNASGATYVAYLFASCPGVSKVGSYTGTGATQVIDCGFTGGARFVLIKRRDSTGGNWMVWDSARGIVSGNDPYISLNSTAAEVTNTDWVDTAASGFELSNAGGNLANSNGGAYLFLAIA